MIVNLDEWEKRVSLTTEIVRFIQNGSIVPNLRLTKHVSSFRRLIGTAFREDRKLTSMDIGEFCLDCFPGIGQNVINKRFTMYLKFIEEAKKYSCYEKTFFVENKGIHE